MRHFMPCVWLKFKSSIGILSEFTRISSITWASLSDMKIIPKPALSFGKAPCSLSGENNECTQTEEHGTGDFCFL